MSDIGQRVARVQERIADAASRSGRNSGGVTLMAVTKTVAPDRASDAVAAGIRVLGESRVQEAEAKIPLVEDAPSWHLVGRLQSNKARLAAALFDAVHSLDRPSLVSRLDAGADPDRPLTAYVQVEWVRTDRTPAEVRANTLAVCEAAKEAPGIHLAGLMTLPPFEPEPEAARPWFRRLRQLRDEIEESLDVELPGLSMGMSNDFEIAVEEGATIVRVGSAIFGERA